MFIKPLNYYSTSRAFLNKAWGHGKFMASKVDGILRQGMEIYGAVKPIAEEAANLYGGTKARQAMTHLDRNVSKAVKQYSSVRDQATQGSAIVDRLANSIGGY